MRRIQHHRPLLRAALGVHERDVRRARVDDVHRVKARAVHRPADGALAGDHDFGPDGELEIPAYVDQRSAVRGVRDDGFGVIDEGEAEINQQLRRSRDGGCRGDGAAVDGVGVDVTWICAVAFYSGDEDGLGGVEDEVGYGVGGSDGGCALVE